MTRLTATWADEYARWQGHDLSARRSVSVRADGVYRQARLEAQAECILVMIGARPEGRKELVGFQVGVRESAQSWRALLVDVKRRGLRTSNPIESALATVRHRTVRTKGALSLTPPRWWRSNS